jgi:diguanylate cyclase (GGDEF)-like protein
VALESVTVREELNNRVSLGDHYARLSTTDELTGLLNRRGFAELAPQAIEVAHSEGIPVVMAYIDINGLKRINDTEGHAAGDVAITGVAEALRVVGGATSVLGRLGGDEYSGVFLGYDVEPLRDRLAAEITARHPAGASIGLAPVAPDSDLAMDELIAIADGLMYAEKQRVRTSG